MELRVLGANGTYPTAGHPAAGYLLSHDGTRVWIDAGAGSLIALQDLMDPADLDAVIVSHIHADHSSDLFPAYHYLRFGPTPRSGLPLFVPEGAAQRMTAYVDPDGGTFASTFDVRVPAPGVDYPVGALAFRFDRADHPVPTLLVRAEAEGRSLAYSADTGTDCDLVGLAAGANTLLCEATFQGVDKPAPHHLTAREAGEIAHRAGVERLILTHVLPTLDPKQSIEEAAAGFGGDVMAAAPGLEVLI
ncbi:MAG: MBL fold metallo-hydrolase [Acidimicrobiia bacterium]|nr:MBL fold metallo-hydrolase [Acidimicrobiia bacterium]